MAPNNRAVTPKERVMVAVLFKGGNELAGKFPWRDMQVGDSFFISGKNRGGLIDLGVGQVRRHHDRGGLSLGLTGPAIDIAWLA